MLFLRWSIFFAILVDFCKYSAKMLRVVYSNTPRKLKGAMGYDPITGHGFGPKGRIEKLRQIVTSLIRHERLEGSFGYLDETRGYVELVSHSFYIIILRRYFGSKNARCLHVFPENYIKIGGGVVLCILLNPPMKMLIHDFAVIFTRGCLQGEGPARRGGIGSIRACTEADPPPVDRQV